MASQTQTTQSTRTETAYDIEDAVPWAYRRGISLRKLTDNRVIGPLYIGIVCLLIAPVPIGWGIVLLSTRPYLSVALGLLGYLIARMGVVRCAEFYRTERPARDAQLPAEVTTGVTRKRENHTIARGEAAIRNYSPRTGGPSVGYTVREPCVFISIDPSVFGGLDAPRAASHALEHAMIKEFGRQSQTPSWNLGGQSARGSTLSKTGSYIMIRSRDEDVIDELFENVESVLQDAREVLDYCPCPGDGGCHNCCHTASCGNDNKIINATEAAVLAGRLLEE